MSHDEPAGAECVRAFVNTIEWSAANPSAADRTPEDRIGSPAALRAWLAGNGLLDGGAGTPPATPSDLALAHELRAVLRELLDHGEAPGSQAAGRGPARGSRDRPRGGSRGPGAPGGIRGHRRAARLTARLPLRVVLKPGDQPRLEPAVSGVRYGLARILAAAAALPADDWERLKVCPAGDCRWVFYDESRNRSRRWCSMASCGNRAKVRTYRRRAG